MARDRRARRRSIEADDRFARTQLFAAHRLAAQSPDPLLLVPFLRCSGAPPIRAGRLAREFLPTRPLRYIRWATAPRSSLVVPESVCESAAAPTYRPSSAR